MMARNGSSPRLASPARRLLATLIDAGILLSIFLWVRAAWFHAGRYSGVVNQTLWTYPALGSSSPRPSSSSG
jgi:hypothetical protein